MRQYLLKVIVYMLNLKQQYRCSLLIYLVSGDDLLMLGMNTGALEGKPLYVGVAVAPDEPISNCSLVVPLKTC